MPGQKNTGRKDKELNLDTLSLEMGTRPPQAVDVEEAVIGAMLVESSCVADAVGELSSTSFYAPKCRMIFEAIRKLEEAHESIDLITVSQQLKKDKHLEDVGGNPALAELSMRIGAAAHVERYIQILKEKDIQRKLITASYDILKEAYDEYQESVRFANGES